MNPPKLLLNPGRSQIIDTTLRPIKSSIKWQLHLKTYCLILPLEFSYSSMCGALRSSLNREWKQIRLEWRIGGPERRVPRSPSLNGDRHRSYWPPPLVLNKEVEIALERVSRATRRSPDIVQSAPGVRPAKAGVSCVPPITTDKDVLTGLRPLDDPTAPNPVPYITIDDPRDAGFDAVLSELS